MSRFVQTLESRVLFSVDYHDPYKEGLLNHTLTQEQMRELNFISMEWQGKQIYARPGEWMVEFSHPPATTRPDGTVDLGIEFAGPATPGTEFQAQLDELGLGLRFKRYVGVKHTVLIDVPQGVSYEDLDAALKTLPNYLYVNPNAALLWFPAASPGPDPAPRTEPEPEPKPKPVRRLLVEGGGDVTASVRGGVLVVRGDRAGNDLTVTQGPSGLQLDGGGVTTINGQQGPVTFEGVTRGVRISLGGGDDRLVIDGTTVPGDVRVDTGRGADRVLVSADRIDGDLWIRGASGAKTVELNSTAVGGRTDIHTGKAHDAITLADSTFTGIVKVKGHRGDDAVLTPSSVFNMDIAIR